jgi:hypothetical protein
MAFSFFNWLISLITGRKDVERVRRRALKRMGKVLAANTYGNFYRVKTEEVTADLAQFFYGVYQVIAPAQVFMQNAVQSTRLRMITIHTFLDKAQRDILERFSPENIELRARETGPGDLARQMQEEFDRLVDAFDTGRKNAINECYRRIISMARLVTYDFYFLLRKFDKQLIEHSPGGKSHFDAIPGKTVVNDIQDFLELSGDLDLDTEQDWGTVLRVLKEFRGTDAVNPKLWNTLLADLREVKRSGILEMMVRCIIRDPDWTGESRVSRVDITGEYLEAVRLDTFDRLTLITTAKQDARITACAKTIFGDEDTNRLIHYTELNNELYKQRGFIGLTFARGINFLLVFLSEESVNVQLFSDLILIRGQWISPALFRPVSEAIRQIEALPDTVKKLDDSLSDHGSYGSKMEKALTKTDHSKSQIRYINANLENLNNDAGQIITEAAFNFSVLADSIKDILEDYRRSISMIILNWEELESFSNGDLEGRLSGLHKKLESMLQLLRLIMQGLDGRDGAGGTPGAMD